MTIAARSRVLAPALPALPRTQTDEYTKTARKEPRIERQAGARISRILRRATAVS
jgi:hypothetical protein